MPKDKDNDVEMIDPNNPKKVEIRPVGPNKRVPNFEKPIKVNNITIEKLSEENARHWFFTMERQLKNQYAWQAIQLYYEVGSREYAKTIEHPAWERFDMQAEAIISMGLDQKTDLEAKTQPNAGEKWNFLKESYLESTGPLKADMMMRMANWAWDRVKPAASAYRDLERLAEEFIEMNGNEMVNIRELIILYFLNGLGPEYETFRDNLMSSDAVLERQFVMRKLKQHDHMRKTRATAENASRVDSTKPRGRKCFACQGYGHIAAKCPSQKEDNSEQSSSSNNGHMSQRGGRGGRGGHGGRGSSRQNQSGRSAEEQSIASPNEEEYGGRAVDDVSTEEAGFIQETAYRSLGSQDGWVFDSGATSMSTGDRSIFEYMDRCTGTLKVASGTQMPIKGRGIVKINLLKGQARLGGVIYVPGLAENLLSLEALHLAGYESRGSTHGYELQKNGKTVAHGKRLGRSTYLSSVNHINALLTGPDVNMRRQYARMALSADEVTAKKQELVHRRLGHPGRQRFNDCLELMGLDRSELRLGKSDKMLDDSCEVCIMAKKAKLQSHIPVRKASRPLQRVFMDFWGPSREAMGDERYFLSLIDDCTRFSWLFVKPDRRVENLMQTLDTWLPWVQRQSSQMLLIIRTDNAREFKALEAWGEPKGIEFEFIEPGTPPQNGVAERFNRIVLEIARALLFDAKVHKKYWKYAVLYANYLRNKTTMIKDSEDENGRKRTPYELWFGHQPDLSGLRAWGCRVLYHDSHPDSKLDSRVAEGTFLMYGKSDKQYYVLPRGGSELRLVTNPEFREREMGYCEPPGHQFGHGYPPIPEQPKSGVHGAPTASGGLITSSSLTSGSPASGGLGQGINQETAPENTQPIMNEGAEPTPEQPAEDPQGNENEDSDAMEMDRDHSDHEDHETQLEGERESPEEATPGQPRAMDKQSQTQCMESADEQVDGERCLNKVKQCQDKVTPQSVNEDASTRRSSRIRQPTEGLLESQDQQAYGRKRKTEGEGDLSDRPAQRLRAMRARLAVAAELLRKDCEYELNEEARAAREKAGIRLPKSYSDAVNDPIYGSKWREAIHKEISALISFGTWRVIRRKDVQSTTTISTTRWVFDVKLGPDGRIERFKARLVARGNEQSDDDFEETFAPVFRLDSLRILVALAARYGLLAHMLDASNAFAGSDLDKPNCMEIPEGLQDFDPDAREGMVLELLKSLYGLRQSANLWHRKITGFLMKIGFRPTTADPSVFINNRGLIIALYVDDVVVFGRKEEEINEVKKKLKEFHPMTDSGLVNKLLGIRFTWGQDGSIHLDQQSYASQILEEFGMADCKPSRTPISPSVQLSDSDSPRLGRGDHKLFRRLIGRLIFLITATRPDVSFVVNQLSQFLAEPRQVHLAAAKHVLRYIQATMDYRLAFGAKGRQGLVAYADSAYANSVRNRSTTGFVFMINGSPVAWNSRKQTVTAQSSTEAEYMAVSEAAKQAIWIRHFLYSIGKEAVYNMGPTTIYEDNQGAIKLADNPVNHPKTKHIAVRYHAIREHIANGEIRLEYLSTDRMVADGLTKATNHVTQELLVDGLGLA